MGAIQRRRREAHSRIAHDCNRHYRRARFWIWRNDGWVRLTLEPGETLEHTTGGRNEEGYHYRSDQWQFFPREGVVVCRTGTWARDCDGTLSTYQVHECRVSRLTARNVELRPREWAPLTPEWRETRSCQRDYAAEAMGY